MSSPVQPGSPLTAAKSRDSLRLFGIDLAAVVDYLRDGWSEALRWPALRWLTPSAAVRVLHADGSESLRSGATAKRASGDPGAAFIAIALAEDCVLRRTLSLPRLSSAEMRQAAEFDARAASPFAESDLAWGFVVDRGERERTRVDIALTSRRMVDEQLAAHRDRLGGAMPEVWADGDRPIVIPGYGEAQRSAREHKSRRLLLLLLVLAALQAGALALTPTLQLRAKAIAAKTSLDELMRKVQPQAKTRDELAKLEEQGRLLGRAAQNRPDVLLLLDEVTRRLPDDAVLSRFEISGNTVRISGQADNAAQLLQTLGALPEFRDVRAPGGIARAQAGGKESFTIEFSVAAGAKSS